jgi:ABC-2 type transport system ATP-binding protein
MNQVEALCDRVALINQGQLVVYGAVDEVRRRYSRPEVLVHANGTLPVVAAASSTTREEDGAWRVALANGTEPPDLLRALVGAGASIDRFEQVLAPMEDIFLRVVGEGRA